jgi:hypothetical protein
MRRAFHVRPRRETGLSCGRKTIYDLLVIAGLQASRAIGLLAPACLLSPNTIHFGVGTIKLCQQNYRLARVCRHPAVPLPFGISR